MNVITSFLVSQIEIITLILVLLKWKYQYKDYLFFKIYIVHSYLTDLMGHLLASNKMINIAIVNYNIFVLISTVLVVSFLSRVLKFNRISKMILFGAFFIIWIYDNFILNGIITTNSISRIL